MYRNDIPNHHSGVNQAARHETPFQSQQQFNNQYKSSQSQPQTQKVPPQPQVTPPYPTVPYPGFVDYHTTNISTGSLTRINQRDEFLNSSGMKNSTTYSSLGSFESIPSAPKNQPSLPPKIPLDQAEYRNNSIQSSYSLDSGSTIESNHTSNSKIAKGPETIKSFDEVPPPPYEDLNYGMQNTKPEKHDDSKAPIPKMTQQLDRLSDELQQFQIDGGMTKSPSRVLDPNLINKSTEQTTKRKPPPTAEPQQPHEEVPIALQPNKSLYSDEVSLANFNRIKDFAIEDFRKGNFSADPQIDWIKTMLQYASDEQFMKECNINGEKLTRTLSPNDVKKNEQIFIKQAIKLLKKVVHVTKDPDAQYIVACLYSNSPSIKVPYPAILEKDYAKSFDYYTKAANQGHPLAMYRLGVSYEIGIGTSQNDKKAMECFIRSAEFRCVASMFKLGMIYSRGALKVPRSASKSLNWLNKAAELASKENPHSLFELAKYHEYDFPFLKNETLTQSDANFLKELQSLGLNKDERVALQYYKEAAKLLYAPAQCKLGWCYEYGKLGCVIDPRRSIGWYSRAAKQGNFIAEMALSGWYLTGASGVLEPNDKEAFLWARKSAESGFVKAEYALGYYYEVGLGCQADFELSRKFYLKAATQGHDKAIAKLREMRGH